MRKKVTIVELAMFERMVPLVAGYLEAFARLDTHLDNSFVFEKLSMTPQDASTRLLGYLTRNPSDIYAFSCYVWNAALIKSIVSALQKAQPDSHYLLGGPQVMRQADRYLSPQFENAAVCNGEGEQTFADYLRAMTDTRHDLSTVKGLSFYRDQELVTTLPADRLHDLDAVPSPYLSGLFDYGEYSSAVIETNRGCPFRCGFCFWGAATNDRVFKFEESRIREELTWISKAKVQFMYIADANWGMLKRDVELTKHIVENKNKYETPRMIYYSSAKNNPSQVMEITQLLRDADLMITQPVSLQTTSPESLEMINRQNIKSSAYANIQQRVNELKISSYIELIWPLPGETLDSLQQGIANLYEAGAATIIVYPHLLLHNTDLFKRRESFGFVTRAAEDPWGEAEIVVATATASEAEFRDGMRYFYALHMLRNTRALYFLSNYLHGTGLCSYKTLLTDFVEFCKGAKDSAYVKFVEDSIETNNFYDFVNYGKATHLILYEHRQDCNELLRKFVSSRSWWSDTGARCLFELDHVMKPHVYGSTPLNVPVPSSCGLRIEMNGDRGYSIDVPEELASLCRQYVFHDQPEGSMSYSVDHRRRQYPYMKTQSLWHNASACHSLILRIQEIVPNWGALGHSMSVVQAASA